ncbi:MAG: biopolymer transporter ExbB [Vampirovibrio sp.]|jgi:biopolymer transport protein ExbB|nr:biopolymer transporter ExbB [Vampirovibrio sp.]
MNASNPYGFMSLWEQGDWVTKLVALLLFSMSVLSWYVIIMKSLHQSKLRRQAAIAGDAFWHTKSLDEGIRLFGPEEENNPFRSLAADGINAAAHHRHSRTHSKGDLHDSLNPSEWLTSCLRRSIENITHNLQTGLPILASVGSTAPFVGLFGTVWGIYHALVGIGVSGQASIDKVAGPVGEALIMTAFGLAVAIPAVLGYNALTNNNKKIMARIRNFAHDLHACLLTGDRVGHSEMSISAGEPA